MPSSRRPLTLRAGAAVTVLCAVTGLASCAEDQTVREQPRQPRQLAVDQDREARVPGTWPGGPSRRELRRAARVVADMSVRERAGQVVVAGWSGTVAPTQLVRGNHLGGVIVMESNVGDPATLRGRLRRLQADSHRRFPLWIGVDQEGGRVQRLGPPFTGFGPYMGQGAARDDRLTAQVAEITARELRAAGFTSVFAPDADVTSGPTDPTIGSRSASDRPELAARTIAASMRGYTRGGVLPVLKHFPGHGSVPVDSHLQMPVQDASMRQLRRRDLVPFARAVEQDAPAVMVGHIALRAVDPGVPSSLSRPVVTGLLRRDLGYDGVVVTDALNMGAITPAYDSRTAAVRALSAGSDVLLMPPDPVGAVDAVADAVQSGTLPGSRLKQAATRMVALLLHQEGLGPSRTPRLRSHPQMAREQARAAITSVSGPCRGRLVGAAVRPLGTVPQVAAFTAAARAAGLPLSSAANADTVALRGYRAGPASADVVVAMDTPYLLAASTAPVRLATFGSGPAAMRALVGVLTGQARAPGHLPVRVAGLSRRGC